MIKFNKIKNNKKLKFLISYYIIFLLILGISSSMARYTNKINLITKISVAQLNFSVQDNSAPENKSLKSISKNTNNQIINLSNTVIEDGYGGKTVIPGSKGIININLDFTNVETDVEYYFKVNKENIPSNLEFYVDNDYQTSIDEFKGIAQLNDRIINKKIYWIWKFNELDESKYINTDLDVEITIHIEQKVGNIDE